jgi:hypothetical protein
MRSPAHGRFIFVSRLAAMIALAGIVWLAASPGVERRDGRWLLLVNGVPVDVLGTADETWQRLTSDCSQIAEVSGDSAATAPLLTGIREFSPPDSLSATIHSFYGTADWWVVEASFDHLPPAWIVLHQSPAQNGDLAVRAVWSGSTFPWRAMPFAGAYLQAQLPDVPPALLRCGKLRLW